MGLQAASFVRPAGAVARDKYKTLQRWKNGRSVGSLNCKRPRQNDDGDTDICGKPFSCSTFLYPSHISIFQSISISFHFISFHAISV